MGKPIQMKSFVLISLRDVLEFKELAHGSLGVFAFPNRRRGGHICEINNNDSQAQWLTPLIPVMGRLRREDQEFKSSLVYTVSLKSAWTT